MAVLFHRIVVPIRRWGYVTYTPVISEKSRSRNTSFKYTDTLGIFYNVRDTFKSNLRSLKHWFKAIETHLNIAVTISLMS